MKTYYCLILTFLVFKFYKTNGQSAPLDELNLDELACHESHRYFFNKVADVQSQTGNNYNLTHCKMEWNIQPSVLYISGKITHSFTFLGIDSVISFDLAQNMMVDSVTHQGSRLFGVTHQNSQVMIRLPYTFSPGQRDSISIFYKGTPTSSGFGSFFKSTHAGVPVLWTLSQPYGAKDWWPCKNTLTDKIDSIDVYIKTPSAYVGVSNGRLISEQASDTFKIYHWKHRYPITSYLVAIAVTNYTRYADKVPVPNNDSLEVWNYVYPESLNQVRPATRNVVRQIQFFDSLFIRYPFHREQYGHAQFSWGGGMEHQTMSFMGSFGFDLMAHELAHQWFGDYITCRSFKEIWLNEGFATYLNALANQRFNATAFNNWKITTQNAIMSQPGGSIMVDDTLSVARIFDGRLTYQKGAYFLHMLRWHLGDSAFFAAIRNYLNDPQVRFNYATTAQLKSHFETASGQNLDYYFINWYEKQGFPFINYTCEAFDNGLVRITLNQVTSHPSVNFFPIKIPFQFTAPGFDTTVAVWHTSNNQTIEFLIGFQPTNVIFDPERWLIARSSGNIITHAGKPSGYGSSFSVFPNPASDKLHITGLHRLTSYHCKLTNLEGKVFLHFELFNPNSQVDISHVPAGMYILSIGSMHHFKIIISR